MDPLFKQCGIYTHVGQIYEPVDSEPGALLSRSDRRPDSGRGNHRGRLDGFVHRRRHILFHARREDDSDVHLLLDVRLPAHRRLDLGRLGLPSPGLLVRRHRRPHHAGRRRVAAPGWQQPAVCHRLSERPLLRPGLRLRIDRDRARRHAADVRGGRGRDLLHHDRQRKLQDAGHARRCRRGNHPRHVPLPVGRRRQGKARTCNCSAAERFCAKCERRRLDPGREISASPARSGA